MTFDRIDKLYAVVDRKTKQYMLTGSTTQICIFSILKEAHRIAAYVNGDVVRCKRLELYDDPIGLNGGRLKQA